MNLPMNKRGYKNLLLEGSTEQVEAQLNQYWTDWMILAVTPHVVSDRIVWTAVLVDKREVPQASPLAMPANGFPRR